MEFPGTAAHEPFQHHTEGMENNPPGRDQQRPEIKRVVSLESGERLKVYQGGHVYGDGQHGDQN